MRYWIRLNKQTLGPYAAEQIRANPGFTGDTLVCPEGANTAEAWKRLRDVPEFVSGSAPAPQAPPAKPALKDRKDLAKLIIRTLGGSLKKR